MFVKNKEVYFDKNDYNGFHIKRIDDTEREEKLKKEKEDKLLKIKLEIGVLLCGLFFSSNSLLFKGVTSVSFVISFIIVLSACCTLFITTYAWHKNKNLFSSCKWVKLELRVIDKLPEEDDSFYCLDEPDTIKKYYPLLVSDTTTNYVGKVYIDKETYFFCENGKVFSKNFKLNFNE